MEGIVVNDFLHQRIEDYVKKKRAFQDQQKEFSDKIDELEDKLSFLMIQYWLAFELL